MALREPFYGKNTGTAYGGDVAFTLADMGVAKSLVESWGMAFRHVLTYRRERGDDQSIDLRNMFCHHLNNAVSEFIKEAEVLPLPPAAFRLDLVDLDVDRERTPSSKNIRKISKRH